MDENNYKNLATQEILHLLNIIETQDSHFILDYEYYDGVLDITLPSGAQYVINRHAPSQQIWVSSPVSSASHFALKSSGKWLNRQELELRSMLQDELKTYVSLNFD